MTGTRDSKHRKDAARQRGPGKQQRDTMRKRATVAKAKSATAALCTPEPDIDLGRNIMAAREKLARRLMRLAAEAKESWRGCARPSCRRAKTCRGELPLPCLALHKAPPLSPEESAWVAADILRALRAQRQRLAAAGLVEEMEE